MRYLIVKFSSSDKKPDPLWPKEGRVQMENLSLYYDPDDPPVLKNLNIIINPGEKVCIKLSFFFFAANLFTLLV